MIYMSIQAVGVGAFFLMYALWLFFLAVMNLQRARDAGTLSAFARAFGYPILLLGYLLDAAVNVLILTFILVELPSEILVTARLSRHARSGSGWRSAFAKFICRNLLDPYDPSGCHCK